MADDQDTAATSTSVTTDGHAHPQVVVRQAPVAPKPSTPSWATGEFYIALAPIVVVIVGAFGGHGVVPADVEKQLAAIGTGVAGAYALGRTLLKAVHVHAAAKVAAADAMSAAAVARSTPPPPAVTHGDAERLADAVADVLDRRFVLRRRVKR